MSNTRYMIHFHCEYYVKLNTRLRVSDSAGYKGLNSVIWGTTTINSSKIKIFDHERNLLYSFVTELMEVTAKFSEVKIECGGRTGVITSDLVKLVDSHHGETAWANSIEVVARIDAQDSAALVDFLCKACFAKEENNHE